MDNKAECYKQRSICANIKLSIIYHTNYAKMINNDILIIYTIH